jgi:hypothetical protein
MTDQVLIKDVRWQNILFCKSCYCSEFSHVLLKEVRNERENERKKVRDEETKKITPH